VVVGPLHALADISDVGKDSTSVTLTQTLRWGDLVRLGTARQQIGVVALNEGEESGDEQRVGDGLGGVVGPDACAGFEVALGHLFLFALCFLLCETGLGELSFEVGGVLGLLRLLLLLQGCGVEFAVCAGSGRGLIVGGFAILGLLGLLLL
jgi:hypothetical protein